MNSTEIDRLTLDLPAMAPADARRLALLVAAGLAEANGDATAGPIPLMRVTVAAAPPLGLETLARRIVDDTLRQIRRSP